MKKAKLSIKEKRRLKKEKKKKNNVRKICNNKPVSKTLDLVKTI